MLTESATTEFLGVNLANLGYEDVVAELDRLSRSDRFSYIVTPNVDHVVMLHEHEDEGIKKRFTEAYEAAAFRLCDSRILQLLAKFRGINLEVLTGSDLTKMLLERGHFADKKVAIVGGDGTMIRDLVGRFPATDFVQHVPPMGLLKRPDAIRDIEFWLSQQQSHYVLFAVGSPQSEIIAKQCFDGGRLKGIGLCIGASIDFILERKTRAPLWLQRARLEWAFRLCSEPRRLWRRYLLRGPRIIAITLKDLFV
jgi:exopolysaccharide biosynthesis WecB/TagA/CpsF family protein